MGDRIPEELIEAAWTARRESFALPEDERQAVLASVRRDLERAVDLLAAADRDVDRAHALHLLAHVESGMGASARAGALWLEAVGLLRAAGDPQELAHKVRHLGDFEWGRGRWRVADGHYREALELYRAHGAGSELEWANTLQRCARSAEKLGSAAGARALWAEARDRYEAIGLEEGVREAERRIAALG